MASSLSGTWDHRQTQNSCGRPLQNFVINILIGVLALSTVPPSVMRRGNRVAAFDSLYHRLRLTGSAELNLHSRHHGNSGSRTVRCGSNSG